MPDERNAARKAISADNTEPPPTYRKLYTEMLFKTALKVVASIQNNTFARKNLFSNSRFQLMKM